MVSGGSTPIGSRPVSTFGNPLVFKPSAAALRKAIEKVELSKVPKASKAVRASGSAAIEEGRVLNVDDNGYDVVRPSGASMMECEVKGNVVMRSSGVPLGEASSRMHHETGIEEPMESEEPDYEELFYSAGEDDVVVVPPSTATAAAKEEEEPVYAVPMKKKLRDRLINVIGSVGGGGGGSSSGGSSGDVSQDRTPLPTPRNGLAIHVIPEDPNTYSAYFFYFLTFHSHQIKQP